MEEDIRSYLLGGSVELSSLARSAMNAGFRVYEELPDFPAEVSALARMCALGDYKKIDDISAMVKDGLPDANEFLIRLFDRCLSGALWRVTTSHLVALLLIRRHGDLFSVDDLVALGWERAHADCVLSEAGGRSGA